MAVDADSALVTDDLMQTTVDNDVRQIDPQCGTDAESDAAAPKRSGLAPVIAVGLAVVVALAGLAGWLGYRSQQSNQSQQLHSLYVDTARQGVVDRNVEFVT